MTDSSVQEPTLTRDPLESLAALRVAHLNFLRDFPRIRAETQDKPAGNASLVEQIRQFVDRAKAAGSFIEKDEERAKAQSILDYWSAELVSASDAIGNDFTPAILATFDERRATDTTGQSERSEEKLKSLRDASRQQIRFAALARAWRDAHSKHGYLLSGDALGEAAKFRDLDPDIAGLVAASEENQKSQRFRKYAWMLFGAAVVLACGACVWVLYQWHFSWLPNQTRATVVRVNSGSLLKDKLESHLRELEKYQPYLPPEDSDFDFSRAPLQDLHLPTLRLYGPKFVAASLSNAKFENATLPNAHFSDSRIINSRFTGAKLKFAQLMRAEIRQTSFARAELYRATFNEALVCNVDFSEADLRKAWFRGVTFDKDFATGFKNAPWWLAAGWTGDQIDKLSKQHSTLLKETKAFKDDLERSKEEFATAKAGSYELAVALNNIAWTRATYGLDIQGNSKAPGKAGAVKVDPRCLKAGDLDKDDQKVCEVCLTSSDMPDNALDAAKQAICIVKFLNLREGEKGIYSAPEKNIKDTLAYVLMQSDEMDEATKYLEEVLDDPSKGKEPSQAPPGESIFRNAVAQFSLAKKEADPAIRKKITDDALNGLKSAVEDEDYIPSHELHTLKQQMDGDFWNKLMSQFNRINPLPRTKSRC